MGEDEGIRDNLIDDPVPELKRMVQGLRFGCWLLKETQMKAKKLKKVRIKMPDGRYLVYYSWEKKADRKK